ncbi:FAD-binding domain-containing protein [Apiospora marii]|uniref:FAD-binding domain-containing protein n=1 Tax=Apiospora marii TaxID=335849 RepID=A0ABR1SRM6_9PEZI
MYNVSDYHNVLAAFVEVQEAMELDHKIGMFINTRKDYIAVGLFYADWSDELPRVFDPFSKLTSLIAAVVPTTNGTLVKLMDLLEQWAYREKDLKHAYLTMTSRISQELYEENFEYCKDILAKLPATVSLHWSIQPLSQAAVEAGEKRGGNILGLQKVPQSLWIFACDWKEDVDDDTVHDSLRQCLKGLESMAVERGVKLDLRFPTFAGASQDVLGSFGNASVDKLREVAAKYDPDGFFQERQCGGFLLRDL